MVRGGSSGDWPSLCYFFLFVLVTGKRVVSIGGRWRHVFSLVEGRFFGLQSSFDFGVWGEDEVRSVPRIMLPLKRLVRYNLA